RQQDQHYAGSDPPGFDRGGLRTRKRERAKTRNKPASNRRCTPMNADENLQALEFRPGFLRQASSLSWMFVAADSLPVFSISVHRRAAAVPSRFASSPFRAFAFSISQMFIVAASR